LASHLLPVSQAVLFSKRFFLPQPETSNPYKENRPTFFSRPNLKPLKAILNSPSQTKAADDNAKDNKEASTLRQTHQGHVLRRQVTVKLFGSCWLQSLWRMRWEHKSCTVMALLDGWMLRRHKSWMHHSFYVKCLEKKKKKTMLSAPFVFL
ncbi:hypothetical protein NC652_021606, partial [Populus alba x Populus x berolinensis]